MYTIKGLAGAMRRLGERLQPPKNHSDSFLDHYSHKIQMSLGQVHAIVGAIKAAGPGCRLLVFGCGNDSNLWQAANALGKTVFLENHQGWLEATKERNPTLDIRKIDYGDSTVANSMPINLNALRRITMPSVMREHKWDVIVVDSPMGFSKTSPGRSLPIYWAGRVASPSTQIFVDDYERPLERAYADRFLNSTRTWQATIPRQVKGSNSTNSTMLWSMGTGAKDAETSKQSGRGAVIFILDSKYLRGLKTLTYTIREAIAADTHDLVVLTNDPAVKHDPFVNLIAHRIELLTDVDIAAIKQVDSSMVSEKVRHAEIGKYTFLKFFAFRDMGYSHHLFLDVDMICLDKEFRFTDLVGGYDFGAAPTMGSKFLRVETDTPDAIYERVKEGLSTRYSATRSFNSGVFFLGKSLMGESSVDRLVAIGASEKSPLEQTLTARLVTTVPGLRFRSLSARYNFPEGAARAIGEKRFNALRHQIKFLHFNDPGKPWTSPESEADWLDDLWFEQERQSTDSRSAGPLA